MNIVMNKTLFEAAARTFEELGFMQPVAERSATAGLLTTVHAAVDFNGPLHGRLDVAVPNTILPVLAANMLGTDEPPQISRQLDALCEIANVIAGNFLPEFAGSEAVFELSPPRLSFGSDRETRATQPAGTVSVFFDEGSAEVRVYMDASLPLEPAGGKA